MSGARLEVSVNDLWNKFVDTAQALIVGYGLFLLYFYRWENLWFGAVAFFVASQGCIWLETNQRSQKIEGTLYALLALTLLSVGIGWDVKWAVWTIGGFLIAVNGGTVIIPALVGARMVVGKD